MVNSRKFFSFENACKVLILGSCLLRLANGQYKPTAECNCGYGGLCVRNQSGVLQKPRCSTVCPQVSFGFYKPSDCHTIENHCTRNRCQNGGTCVPTFGSYFCNCPKGFTGQKCHLRESAFGKEFKEYGISNEYYVYYQVQSLENGDKTPLFLIYDPGDQQELQKKKERGVKMIATCDDGRIYYPTKRFGDLVKKDYHEICLEDARAHPQLWDEEVCKFVPKGEHYGFEIGTRVYAIPPDKKHYVYYAPAEEAGFWVEMHFKVLWVDEVKGLPDTELFSQTVRIFRYTFSKVRDYCNITIGFDGCSTESEAPHIYLRGNPILISTKTEPNQHCKGIIIPKKIWFLMRGKSVDGSYDTSPKKLYGVDDQDSITFPPRSFNDGLQLLNIMLVLQGDPPHYGGQTRYAIFARCWLKIVLGPLNVQALGGSVITASCFNPLKLDLISLNPGITVIELVYRYKCNVTGDPECAREKVTDVPAIRKLYPQCDTVVRFDVKVQHEQAEYLTQNLTVIVHFIRSQIQIRLECLYNCFPIDPAERTVIVATTTPYTSGTIDWNVFYGDPRVEIGRVEKWVDTFYPLESTRILRFDGLLVIDVSSVTPVEIESTLQASYEDGDGLNRFSVEKYMKHDTPHDEEISSYINPETTYLMAKENGSATPLHVTVNTKSSDLSQIARKFTFNRIYKFESPFFTLFNFTLPEGDTIQHEFQPLTYSLVQASDDFKDSLVMKYEFNRTKLVYAANWPKVQLCIRDAMDVEACSDYHKLQAKPFPVTIGTLERHYRTNNIKEFMHYSVFWFSQGLIDNYIQHPGNKSWEYPLEDRAQVLEWMRQFKDLREHYVRAILSVLAMCFYSHDGNKAEDLLIFWEEFIEYKRARNDSFIDEVAFHKWVNLRQKAVDILYDVAKWTRTLTETTGGEIKFRLSEYGDVLDGIVRCLNLADIQASFVLRLVDWLKFSFYKDLMVAELEISARESQLKMNKIQYITTAAISRMSRLYYGIRAYGKKHLRIYSMRDSYIGILRAFDRERQWDVSENLLRHVNYIFQSDDFPTIFPINKWLDMMNLTLPNSTDLPSLYDKELRFSVFVVQNRPGDHEISPTLYVDMRNVAGERYESLPDGQNYTVTFPVMLDGQLANMSSTDLWSDVLITPKDPANDYKYFSVYKIIFPNVFSVWELRIFTDKAVPIKISINLENLPQIDDVDREPAQTGKFHAASSSYLIEHTVQASDFAKPRSCNSPGNCRDQLPLYFYFGLLLTNSTPVETPVKFSIKDTVDVCDVREPTFTRNLQPCAGIQRGEFNTIDCECQLFGFVVATVKYVRINRVYAVDIGLVIPTTIAPVQIIVPLFMICFILVVLAYSFWSDWRRNRMETLIYLDDCHPLDKYVYVLGVYTGNSIMAGTRASVALKIIGLNSSSRVHLLKSRGRRTLRSATDDWFVIATNQPLGKIASVMMWHNHKCLSDWYCNHILIFDMKQDNWYFVNVERWFKLYPVIEDSEMAQLKAFKFGNMESALKAMPHQFRTNYIMESRNTHHFFSLFLLHLRSLTNNEHRACIFLIKFFAMWFWVWFVEDVEYKEARRSIDEPNIDEIYIDGNVAIKISQIVLLSYLFTTPYYLLIRSTQMSGLIQKKTTNPINIEAIRQEMKTVRSEQEEKLAKEKRGDQTGKPPKSVLFQLESIDRTESAQSWIARPGEDEHVRRQRAAPKKHWSATHYQMPRWKKFLIMAFGPSQFRCINVKHQLYEVKMAKRLTIARVLAGLVILIAVGLVIAVEELTSYWRKSYVSIFEFSVSLLADILIINPLLILLNSIIIFLFLKTSNRELMFWSENTPISEVKPKSFKGYIETATKKEYQPLKTSEIRRYEYIQLAYTAVRMILVYAYLGFCMYVIATVLNNRYDIGYHYTVRAILQATKIKSKYEVRPTVTLDEVIDVDTVKYFLPSTFGDLKFIYPNGQPISKDKGRWFLDRASRPSGPASIMITCISDEVRMRIPKVFVPYFEKALGFIDQGEILKTPIVLADKEVYYDSEITHKVHGASDEDYGLSGHRATLPMNKWIEYYVSMVTYVEDFIDKPDVIPRVMVLTLNAINPSTYRITTCDVVVEILPSGVTSAKLEINSVKAYSPARKWTIFMRFVLVALTLCYTWLTIVDVSKIGFKDFVDSWYGTMKIGLLVTGSLVTVSTFTFFLSKYPELDRFADYPVDKYKDIHLVQTREFTDSILLAVFLLTMCADIAVAVREAFGSRLRIFSRASTQGFRMACTMLLWILILSRAAESAVSLYGLKRWYFLIAFYCKAMFPLKSKVDVSTATEVYVIGALMLLILTSKFCTALFIYQFEESETFYRMKRTKPQQAQSVSILKYSAYRKHTVADIELLFLSKRRSSPKPKTKTPSPEAEPVQLAPNLDSRLTKLSKRFFGFGWSDNPEPQYRQSPKKSNSPQKSKEQDTTESKDL